MGLLRKKDIILYAYIEHGCTHLIVNVSAKKDSHNFSCVSSTYIYKSIYKFEYTLFSIMFVLFVY